MPPVKALGMAVNFAEAVAILQEIQDWAWLDHVLHQPGRISQREQKEHDDVTTRITALLRKVKLQ